MKLLEYVELVREGAIPLEEYIAEVLEEAKRVDEKFACFTTVCEERALSKARELEKKVARGEFGKGRLLGVPITVKDCLCVQGVESCAGSSILKGHIPSFSATAVEKVEADGGIVIGKTAMDEFGFGSFCTQVGKGFRVPRSPIDSSRVVGGSSGGSGVACAAFKFPHVSIAESTGGSITAPAAFCGVAGITPTYGKVSRWGLIDFASSLDKIGAMAQKLEDAALLLEVISGRDERDATSFGGAVGSLGSSAQLGVSGLRIGLPKEFFEGADESVAEKVWKTAKKLESEGAILREFSLPSTKYSVPAYYLIAVSEASTHLAKFTGMAYGLRGEPEGKGFSEYFSQLRGEGFGREAKRRILLGTFARTAGYREKYYVKAAKARTKIIQEFKSAFKEFDVLLTPSMPILPPKFEEAEKLTPSQVYALDVCTVPPSLAGLPHVSVPVGSVRGLPVGAQLICDHFEEKKCMQSSLALERACSGVV